MELVLYQTVLRVFAQLTALTEPIPRLGPLAGKERVKCWDAGGYDADELFETGKEVKDFSQRLPEGKWERR